MDFRALTVDAEPRPVAEARQVEPFPPASLAVTGFDHAQIVMDAMALRRG